MPRYSNKKRTSSEILSLKSFICFVVFLDIHLRKFRIGWAVYILSSNQLSCFSALTGNKNNCRLHSVKYSLSYAVSSCLEHLIRTIACLLDVLGSFLMYLIQRLNSRILRNEINLVGNHSRTQSQITSSYNSLGARTSKYSYYLSALIFALNRLV